MQTIKPYAGPVTNRSGTIAAADTAQDLAPENGSRKWFLFQNRSATAMQLDFGMTATADAMNIAAGGSFVAEAGFVPTDRVSIICATMGAKFFCKEG